MQPLNSSRQNHRHHIAKCPAYKNGPDRTSQAPAPRTAGVALSRSGVIQRTCEDLQALCGWSVNEAKGRSAALLLHPLDRPAFQDALHAATRSPGEPCVMTARVRGSGRVVHVRATQHAASDEILVDLEPDDHAPASDGLSPGAAHVLHELRHPLTPLRLQVELLRIRGSTDLPGLTGHLDMMERNLDLLERLVQDLQQSFLPQGALQLRREAVDLGDLASDVIAGVSGQAEKQGIHMAFQQGPVSIHGDGDRLTQVLHNLLGNAIKFTAPGGTVDVRCRRVGNKAEVRVTDSGRGLSKEDMGLLFRPFSQVPAGDHGPWGGSGLGLSVCKSLVEAHGGSIWAESAGRDRGSTFVVHLPASP